MHGEVSLVEQDTIEYVSVAYLKLIVKFVRFFFHIFYRIFQYKYVYTLIGVRLLGKLKICIGNAVYIVERLVLQTVYVLNKEILQFLGQKSAGYNGACTIFVFRNKDQNCVERRL